MKPRGRFIIITLLLVCVQAFGQSIPKLKQASEISTGTFANGIDYCLIDNNAVSGRADFALVQTGNFDTDRTRESFAELEHSNVSDFIRRHGIPYTEDGLVAYYEGARTFRLSDINVSNSALADSTFLMMLDFMQLSSGPQTLIICGDINKDNYRRILSTLSLIVPKTEERSYDNTVTHDGSMLINERTKGEVTLSFELGTFPMEQAGTAIPLVSEYLFLQARNILSERIKYAFKEEGIPYYVSETKESLTVRYNPVDEEKAKDIIHSVIHDVANGDTTIDELSHAKKIALPIIVNSGLRQGKPNAFYIDKCISSILTGSNLASEETIRNFFDKRRISPKRDLELFNNYVSALLGDQFTKVMDTPKRQIYPDLQAALKTSGKSVKLASSTREPLLGGSHWTFSNGIKVVYKYSPNVTGFNYCLALRGGASSMHDLYSGESRFLSDIFKLNRYAGIEGEDFMDMLKAQEVDIHQRVSLEGTSIYGNAPSDEIETVLKALLKIAYDRSPDDKAFRFYKKCRILRTSTELPSTYAVMDSLICPTYNYHSNSSACNIRDDFHVRANRFFDERFSNVSDGVFVFIGNIPENVLLSALCKYLGAFATYGPYALRERVQYNFYSGRSTYIVEGEDTSVNFAATGLLPVTIDNYLMFLLAKEAVQRQLAKSLEPLGMYAQVESRYDTAPVERFTLYVTLRDCNEDGLPAQITVQEPLESMQKVREEFLRMQYMVISEEEFASYKRIVKGKIAAEMASSQGMMEYALYRYSNGRDLTSDYSAKLDKIVIDDIRWILEEIISSGIVEYIIR